MDAVTAWRRLPDAVLETNDLLAVVVDTDGRLKLWNKAWTQTFGDAVETGGGLLIDPLAEPSLAEWKEKVQTLLTKGSESCFFIEHPTSADEQPARWIRWSLLFVRDDEGRVTHALGIGVDLTLLKQAEEDLKARQGQLQLIADHLPMLLCYMRPDLRQRFNNRASLDWFGEPPAAMFDRTLQEMLGNAAWTMLQPSLQQALAGERVVFEGELPLRVAGPRFVQVNCVPHRSAERTVDGVLLVFNDLSGRWKLELKLREQLAFQHSLLDTLDEAVVILTSDGCIEGTNAATERIFGYPDAELHGRNISMLLVDGDGTPGVFIVDPAADPSSPAGTIHERQARHRDGHPFPVETLVGRMDAPGRPLFVGIIRDITRRKQLEAEARARLNLLAQQERVGALNELAPDLAHEINQPLMAIASHAQACLDILARHSVHNPALVSSLRQIAAQSERAGEITRRLRQFVQHDRYERAHASLNRIIRDAVWLLELEMGSHGVRVEFDLANGLPSFECDRMQIEQVVLNLVRNAIEAMHETPRAQRLIRIGSAFDTTHALLRLTVDDQGPGLEDALRSRVFEPFFTTKPGGMGHGLSMSRRIVRAHGGELDVVRARGGGASFVVTLPVSP